MEVFSVFIYRQIDGINVPVAKSELTTIVGDYTFNNVQITPDE